jgi:hypothetical protein
LASTDFYNTLNNCRVVLAINHTIVTREIKEEIEGEPDEDESEARSTSPIVMTTEETHIPGTNVFKANDSSITQDINENEINTDKKNERFSTTFPAKAMKKRRKKKSFKKKIVSQKNKTPKEVIAETPILSCDVSLNELDLDLCTKFNIQPAQVVLNRLHIKESTNETEETKSTQSEEENNLRSETEPTAIPVHAMKSALLENLSTNKVSPSRKRRRNGDLMHSTVPQKKSNRISIKRQKSRNLTREKSPANTVHEVQIYNDSLLLEIDDNALPDNLELFEDYVDFSGELIF